MLILPAIDLRKGRCVRLVRGDVRDETVYSNEPVSMAKLWQLKGARYLHGVDLDGALTGEPKNLKHVFNIIKALRIPVEFGGGVRDYATLKKILDKGVRRVILGTSAMQDEKFLRKAVDKFGKRVVVGIDARNGYAAVKGWKEQSKVKAVDLALEMQELGVKTIIYTDINRDGLLTGPNIKACKEIAQKVKMEVIASGGVTSLRDVANLRAIEKYGVTGAIVGKSLYSGDMELKDAIKVAKGEMKVPAAKKKKG
jgi:phosphoribosylformimino-5-aminoimidazole carboxamide ribotide isomerase